MSGEFSVKSVREACLQEAQYSAIKSGCHNKTQNNTTLQMKSGNEHTDNIHFLQHNSNHLQSHLKDEAA